MTFKYKGDNVKGIATLYDSYFLIEKESKNIYIQVGVREGFYSFIESEKIMTKDEFVKDFE